MFDFFIKYLLSQNPISVQARSFIFHLQNCSLVSPQPGWMPFAKEVSL